jgi:hypothetical protein
MAVSQQWRENKWMNADPVNDQQHLHRIKDHSPLSHPNAQLTYLLEVDTKIYHCVFV